MSASNRVMVALFPLPGSVQLPGTTAQFHIFEPRYRKMIHDCVAEKKLCGVAHVRRQIAAAHPHSGGPEDELQRNQATFEPLTIYGAGHVEVREILDDGRLLITIPISGRFRTHKIVSEIPYFLAESEELVDETESISDASREILIGALHLEFAKVFQDRFALVRDRLLQSGAYDDLARLTFEIFQFIKVDPAFLQMILENLKPSSRAEMILNLLSRPAGGSAH